MASGHDAVFHRRNNQIQDAIDGQNLKQAMQLIEKRIKKGEDTRFLRAWKAHILFLHADEAHKQRGIAETLELCNAEPPTTDLETLDKLFRTLQKLPEHNVLKNSLWEKAARAKPQDLEIQMDWFTSAFESNDWKSAQKAAMSLQKNFPRERKYFFWAIVLSHLIASDERSSETDRKIFGTLAYRMIAKAAADTPVGPVNLLKNPRAIQTTEELRLLIKIFWSQSRYAEAVEILSSDNLGLKSQIVRFDREFIGLRALSLGHGQLWEGAQSFVKAFWGVTDMESHWEFLQENDDWGIWELLIDSTRGLKFLGIAADTPEFLQKYIDFNPKARNASLALIEVVLVGIEMGKMTTEDLLSACQKHVDRHKSKLYVFSDLRRVLRGDKHIMSKMLDYILSGKEEGKYALVPEINALKLAYCLNISGSENNPPKERIEAFVVECMKLYQAHSGNNGPEKTLKQTQGSSSTIESQPKDDLCLLAAMALLRTSEADGAEAQVPHTALIRAAGILERLALDSPHNYQALLLLVRIYLMLGAGSIAMSTFSKMSVKQVQYESVAHNLLTRLATIHPHSAPPVSGAELKDFEPQSAFVQSLNFYRNSEVTTLKYRTRCLEEGSYVNGKELVEVRDRLKNSICRRMYALDVRRAQRLVGGDPMTRYDDLARDTAPTEDQRDYDVFMDCEYLGKASFEERMRVGPIPQENWLASARITDHLFSLLKGIALQKPLTPEMDLPVLDTFFISEEQSDQTDAEKDAAKVHSQLLKVATCMAGSKTTTLEQADNALELVEGWLNSKKSDLALDDNKTSPLLAATALYLQSDVPTAPTWRFFHSIWTLLETLKALSQLVTLASRKASKTTKLPKERVERLSSLVNEVFELVRSNTRALKQHVLASGVLGGLVDLVAQGDPSDRYGQMLQKTLETTLDTSAVEMFCGSLMESWEEALNGVMSVKL